MTGCTPTGSGLDSARCSICVNRAAGDRAGAQRGAQREARDLLGGPAPDHLTGGR